jgi:CDGSH-type Zn-finger protein
MELAMTDVTITPSENGPNLVKGPVKIVDPDGQEFETDGAVALCRCGHSENKPFCDGTHAKIGFKAVNRAGPKGES